MSDSGDVQGQPVHHPSKGSVFQYLQRRTFLTQGQEFKKRKWGMLTAISPAARNLAAMSVSAERADTTVKGVSASGLGSWGTPASKAPSTYSILISSSYTQGQPVG